jgi:hypothetical protein
MYYRINDSVNNLSYKQTFNVINSPYDSLHFFHINNVQEYKYCQLKYEG